MFFDLNSRLKKIILVGAGAILLAILWVAFFPLWQRESENLNLPSSLSPEAIREAKIKKEIKELSERMRKQVSEMNMSDEEIKKQIEELSEEMRNKKQPSEDEIKREIEQLSKQFSK